MFYFKKQCRRKKVYRYNEIDVESMTSVDEDAWTVDG